MIQTLLSVPVPKTHGDTKSIRLFAKVPGHRGEAQDRLIKDDELWKNPLVYAHWTLDASVIPVDRIIFWTEEERGDTHLR